MFANNFYPQSIPTNGLNEWFTLQQRTSKSKVSGEILLRLFVNSVDVSFKLCYSSSLCSFLQTHVAQGFLQPFNWKLCLTSDKFHFNPSRSLSLTNIPNECNSWMAQKLMITLPGWVSRREKQAIYSTQTTLHFPPGSRRKTSAPRLNSSVGVQTPPRIRDNRGDAPTLCWIDDGTHNHCQVAGSVHSLHRDWGK